MEGKTGETRHPLVLIHLQKGQNSVITFELVLGILGLFVHTSYTPEVVEDEGHISPPSCRPVFQLSVSFHDFWLLGREGGGCGERAA